MLLIEKKKMKRKKINNKIECFTKKHKITTKKIIFCTNGFLKYFNVKKNYSFPITLTASLTRKLTDKEFKDINVLIHKIEEHDFRQIYMVDSKFGWQCKNIFGNKILNFNRSCQKILQSSVSNRPWISYHISFHRFL